MPKKAHSELSEPFVGPSKLDNQNSSLKIAVIGSGIAGLTTGWLAQRSGHRVTLYEQQSTLGMDAHSIDLPSDSSASSSDHVAVSAAVPFRIDVPPRMFNRDEWPRLTTLYQLLGVNSQAVDTSKSFATQKDADLPKGWLKLGDSYRLGMAAAALTNVKARRVAADTMRIGRLVTADSIQQLPKTLTLGQYLKQEAFSDEFVYDFLFPGLAATVLTCSYRALDAYPAQVALQCLLNQFDQSPLQRTTFGTADVVRRLAVDIADVRLNISVETIRSDRDSAGPGQVEVASAAGGWETFDHLIIATQANSALRLLGEDVTFAAEREVLQTFEYEDVPVVVHTDSQLLPGKESFHTCFNFVSRSDRSDAMCTIWLNRFYPEWKADRNIYQTIRPIIDPRPETIIATAKMQRPIVNQHTVSAIEKLASIPSANRNVWLCGSYAGPGVPLLESGVASAIDVARRLKLEIPSQLERDSDFAVAARD